MGLKLFQFGYNKQLKGIDEPRGAQKLTTFVPPEQDGSITIDQTYTGAGAAAYGYSLDFGTAKGKSDARYLIAQYRRVALRPDASEAIDDICDEAIVYDPNEAIIEIVVDEENETIVKAITEEFNTLVDITNFKVKGWEKFKRWYVDGRMYHHIIVDENKPKEGIKDVKYIDSKRIKKIREILREPNTQMIKEMREYFVFSDDYDYYIKGFKIEKEAISYVTSGLLDEDERNIVSYLHKAIRYSNMLNMLEDAVVIYRITRAPERRVFYVDVGNLPKSRAEEYMKNIMNKYRNKITYDSSTGQVKTEDDQLNMQEDFWLPRKDGGRGTEVDILQGGSGLDLDDLLFIQKKLYKSLNVPVSRIESETPFSSGRSTEISRDEVKFHKFIERLRNQFNNFFYDLLKVQLVLKGIIKNEDWVEFKRKISFQYNSDSHFQELLDAEVLTDRINVLKEMGIEAPVGKYISHEWVRKHVMRQSDEAMKEEDKLIKEEQKNKILNPPPEEGENGFGG